MFLIAPPHYSSSFFPLYFVNVLFSRPIRRHTESTLPCRFTTKSFRVRHIDLGVGPRTKLKSYRCKGGTGKNEAFHRTLNQALSGISRLGTDVCDERLLPHVHRYNLERDRKLGRLSKQSTPWVWRERVANDATRECLDGEPFPKAGPHPDVRACGVHDTWQPPVGTTCPWLLGGKSLSFSLLFPYFRLVIGTKSLSCKSCT